MSVRPTAAGARRMDSAEGLGFAPVVKPGPAFAVHHDDENFTALHDVDFRGSKSTGLWFLVIFVSCLLCLIIACSVATKKGEATGTTVVIVLSAVGLWLCIIMFFRSIFVIAPNEGVVMSRFGKYTGTVRTPGVHMVPPWYARKTVSFKLKNFVSDVLKVNDAGGNPIVISGVIVWSVADAAQSSYSTDSLDLFVRTQSESAFRNIAARYPYDSHREGEVSLLSNANEVRHELQDELHARLAAVGVRVHEAQIVRLAYAEEIAGSMLQRQMAVAVVAARSQIVNGAVLMVEDALQQLASRNICSEITPAERVRLAGNLLTVLCGDSRPQSVLNVGS
eukprot:c39462_g1_i1.p1 GENE.c39462_g1_i1~~c39462_g1_i1.p1  ORF type:complete len:336 (+),score=57.49 c39462_g1_i1:92-1099(+)